MSFDEGLAVGYALGRKRGGGGKVTPLTITENGTYTAGTGDYKGFTGFNPVNVNVQSDVFTYLINKFIPYYAFEIDDKYKFKAGVIIFNADADSSVDFDLPLDVRYINFYSVAGKKDETLDYDQSFTYPYPELMVVDVFYVNNNPIYIRVLNRNIYDSGVSWYKKENESGSETIYVYPTEIYNYMPLIPSTNGEEQVIDFNLRMSENHLVEPYMNLPFPFKAQKVTYLFSPNDMTLKKASEEIQSLSISTTINFYITLFLGTSYSFTNITVGEAVNYNEEIINSLVNKYIKKSTGTTCAGHIRPTLLLPSE